MIGSDPDVDIDSGLAVGGIVAKAVMVRDENTGKMSWANALAKDAKESIRRGDVQVLHVVNRSRSSCLMFMVSTAACFVLGNCGCDKSE